MKPFVHTIDGINHQSFLNEKRFDPLTKEPLVAGNKIVICANCKHAHLLDSWKGNGNVCPKKDCQGRNTLNHFPRTNMNGRSGKNSNQTFTTLNKYAILESYRKPGIPKNHLRDGHTKVKKLPVITIVFILLAAILLIKHKDFILQQSEGTINKIKEISNNKRVTSTNISRMTLLDVTICEHVYNREPINIGSTFPAGQTKVYCWSKIFNRDGKYITHYYYCNGVLEANVKLYITDGPAFRTWSSKNIWPGSWEVVIQDDRANTLGRINFNVY